MCDGTFYIRRATMNQQEIDIRFMELAYKEAIKAREKDEIPVGAILVDENNNVIAKGHNLKEKNKSAIDHAEIIFIKSKKSLILGT